MRTTAPRPPIAPAPVGALRPSGPLAACVDHYWFGTADGGSAHEPTSLVLPDGRIDVVLESTGTRTSVTAYGSVTSRTTLNLTPGARYVGIQFRAGCARHFLDAAAHELTDRAAAGIDVLKFGLNEALNANDLRTAIARLDAALLRHLRRVQPSPARIDRLVAAVEQARGNVRVETLAAQAGVSRRQIERDFLDAVGLTPKTFAAILRFRHAGQRLRAGEPIAEAALAAGYADQSHLSRDFRRFVGLAPTVYARGDVAFLQDSKHLHKDDDGFSVLEAAAT